MSTAKIELLADSRQVRTATSDLEQLNRTGSQSDAVVNTLRRAFIALGGAAAVRGATRTIADFSQQISSVAAISGASASDLAKLREETLRLGSTTRFSASQAAEGAQFLARAGFDTEQILLSLNDTLTLAQAGALDLASAADIASNVLTGFRLPAQDAARAVDVLAFAANRSNTDVRQLGEGLSFVAPIAAGLGVSLEETTAAIGALSDAGLQGSVAGTGLRRVLSTLESPTAAVTKRLAALGVDASEVQISTVGLTAALERLRAAGITTGEALEIFGDRGGPAFEVLNSSIPRVREMSRALNEAGGFAQGVADIMDDNLNGALLSVASATEGFVIALGDLGAESAATQTATSLAEAIRGLTDNLDTVVTIGGAVATIFGARMVGALTASTAATVSQGAAALAATVTYDRFGLAISRTTVAMNVATAATRGLSASMALLGGPAGVAFLAGAGLIYFASQARKANEEAAKLTQSADDMYIALTNIEALAEQRAALGEAANAVDELRAKEQQIQAERNKLNANNRNQRVQALQLDKQLREVRDELANAERRLAGVTRDTRKEMEENAKAKRENVQVDEELTAGNVALSDSYEKVVDSLQEQIIELASGADALERYRLVTALGSDANMDQVATVDLLLGRVRELRAAREAAAQAARDEAAAQAIAGQFGAVKQGIAGELGGEAEQARQQLQARIDVIREYAAIEGADREAAMQAQLDAEQAFQQRITEIRAQEEANRIQTLQTQLGAASQFFGDLNALANQFGDEQNAINQALFVAQKAFSIAQSIIAIQTGIAQAAALPFPANLGAMATVAAATSGIVSTIQGVQPPARAQGGQVLGGSQYLVGERGPELVTMRGNGNVTPFNQLMRESSNQQSINQVANINFNLPDTGGDIRDQLAENRDIIYNAVNEALRRQGKSPL